MYRWTSRVAGCLAATLMLVGCSDSTKTEDDAATVAASSTAAAESSAAAEPAIQGVFRAAWSADELKRSPLLMDASEIRNENWGVVTLTFHGRAVSFEQRNEVAESGTQGTFTTDGDVLAMSFTSGVNAGETFTVHFTLEGDTLILTRDPDWKSNDLMAPTPYIIKPWRRVS